MVLWGARRSAVAHHMCCHSPNSSPHHQEELPWTTTKRQHMTAMRAIPSRVKLEA